MPLAAPCLLSLCEAVENSDFLFGVVSRLDTQKSTFDAAKLIHSIVSILQLRNPWLWNFFLKFRRYGVSMIQACSLHLKSLIHSFETYDLYSHCSRLPSIRRSAGTVGTTDIGISAYNAHKTNLSRSLNQFEYLNHLLVVSMFQRPLLYLYVMPVCLARNPGGKKTPQESTHSTPDIFQLHSIIELLNDATINRKQSALKTLVNDSFNKPLKSVFEGLQTRRISLPSHRLLFQSPQTSCGS
jgi:hypothetical protein